MKSKQDHPIIPVFEELKAILKGYNLETVAESAGITSQTMYYWLSGKTRRPYLGTIVKVAAALGLELTLTHSKTAAKNFRLRSVG